MKTDEQMADEQKAKATEVSDREQKRRKHQRDTVANKAKVHAGAKGPRT
jgi:hypothetical protein